MQRCKCGCCRACHAQYKVAQTTEPVRIRDTHRGIVSKKRSKGRKVRLDQLFQTRKDFFYYLDQVEDDKGRALEYQKRYGIPYRPSFFLKG